MPMKRPPGITAKQAQEERDRKEERSYRVFEIAKILTGRVITASDPEQIAQAAAAIVDACDKA